MAKCFRVVGQGIPVRMSDDDAREIVVRDHDGEYCPKHVWKAGGRMLSKLVTDSQGHRVGQSTESLQTYKQRKRRAA